VLLVKGIGHSAEAPAEVLGLPFAEAFAGHESASNPAGTGSVLVVGLYVAILATRFQYPQLQPQHPV
jgi:hypothetical protein